MAGITLAEAIKIFSREKGCSGDREFILDEIQTALEFALFFGADQLLREWKIPVRDNRFTLPRDLGVPVKYKFGDWANSGFGTFQSPYYSFSSTGIQNCCGYYDWGARMSIRATKIPTQFRVPKQGVRVFATTRNSRDVGKQVMVGGNRCGNPIAPIVNNTKVMGDLIKVYMEDDTSKKYGRYVIDDITQVVKDETCDYITLWGLDTETGDSYFLSHYHPDETVPKYTEVEIFSCAGYCGTMIHILGRIDPSIRYIRDEDVLPITSREVLKLLAKRSKYDDSGDFNNVAVMETRISNIIKKQVAYQQAANNHLSFSLGASGGSVVNM